MTFNAMTYYANGEPAGIFTLPDVAPDMDYEEELDIAQNFADSIAPDGGYAIVVPER